MSKLTTIKTLCEIRFANNPLFIDKRGQLAFDTIENTKLSDLAEWNISNDKVRFRNPSGSIYAQASHNSALFQSEGVLSKNSFSEKSGIYFQHVLSSLKVDQITRIGLRVYLVQKSKPLRSMVSKITSGMLNISDDAWEALGSAPADIGLTFNLNYGIQKAQLHMGPMQKSQIKDFVHSKDGQRKLPNNAIFLDFDLFQENIQTPSADVAAFLQNYLNTGQDLVVSKCDAFLKSQSAKLK